MRLSLVLAKWPKVRPNGNIWIGKYRIVPKVHGSMVQTLRDDIEREKQNIFYCLHPAITREQELAVQEAAVAEGPRPDQVWFQMRKAKVEATRMAPMPLSQHFNSLTRTESW